MDTYIAMHLSLPNVLAVPMKIRDDLFAPILRESKCTNALDFNGSGSSEVEGPFKSQAVIL